MEDTGDMTARRLTMEIKRLTISSGEGEILQMMFLLTRKMFIMRRMTRTLVMIPAKPRGETAVVTLILIQESSFSSLSPSVRTPDS